MLESEAASNSIRTSQSTKEPTVVLIDILGICSRQLRHEAFQYKMQELPQ